MLAKTSKKIKKVAIFGDGTAKKKDKHFIDAYNMAKMLVESGYVVVDGGGPGVMLAATLGAKAGGGKVIAVILDPKKEPENYEGTNKENINLVDEKIVTNNYSERLNKLIEVADAFVIFKGGTGTISELGLTWELAKFDYGHHEPLIFFGKFWEKIIKDLTEGLELERKEERVIEVVNRPEEVIKILERISPK